MVKITEKGFTITFEEGSDPLKDITELHDQLIQMLQFDTNASLGERWQVLELLRQLVPDYHSLDIEGAIKEYRFQNSQ